LKLPVVNTLGVAWLCLAFSTLYAYTYGNLLALWFVSGEGTMSSKDADGLAQSTADDSTQVSPLIGYSYPFEHVDDAAWLADELNPSVLAKHGRIAVINAELFVVLPNSVRPHQLGNLGLFKFDQEQ
jgi:hypothetical protein